MCGSCVGHQRAHTHLWALAYGSAPGLPGHLGCVRGGVASQGPMEDPPRLQPLPSPASCRDRKSTGLKLSKKKARRRHTDVRSPRRAEGPLLSIPKAGPVCSEPRTRRGAWRGPPSPPWPAAQHDPPYPGGGCSRSCSLRQDRHWGPPWDCPRVPSPLWFPSRTLGWGAWGTGDAEAETASS